MKEIINNDNRNFVYWSALLHFKAKGLGVSVRTGGSAP